MDLGFRDLGVTAGNSLRESTRQRFQACTRKPYP